MRRSSIVRDSAWNVDGLPPEQVEYYKKHVFEELLPVQSVAVPENNPLQDEQQDFIDSIRDARQPRVSGLDAMESVGLAVGILQQIETSNIRFHRGRGIDIRRAA